MPITSFHADFLGFPIESCNIEKGNEYVMKYNVDCGKWEFVPYGSVVGGVTVEDEGVVVQLFSTCINFIGDLVEATLNSGCVDVEIYTPNLQQVCDVDNVTDTDIEISDLTHGVILTSTDGTRHRITLVDDGLGNYNLDISATLP